MRIALDAMGSDGAPEVEIAGAVEASLDGDIEVQLVGDEAVLRPLLDEVPKRGEVTIVHASECIGMHEPPVLAVRQKKDSSMLVAMRQVKRGHADAVVSLGNTGAVMVAARTILGGIRGVARSAICQTLPTASGRVVLLDLGANVDCTARHLCEFAEMGIAYSHFTLGVESPRVGLLNIGEEDLKVSHVAKEVHRNLKAAAHVNFIGNVEPKGMFFGEADVVVCDGFVGNLTLKTSEAVALLMAQLVREQFEKSAKNKIAAMIARSSLQAIKHKIDPNEMLGGPLLGINGIVIIHHGSADARGVANAIRGARLTSENRLIEHIKENIEELRNVERTITGSKAAES